MAFVEVDEGPSDVWTPEQEAAANAVSLAVKSYIKTAEDLVAANGKYSHLRDKIPEYMANPGNLLMAICTNGVVIRYEKKTDAARKWAVAVIPQGIAEVAALLSQNLVHIESLDTPHPTNENFGVEFKLSVHSPSQGTSHDIAAARIWFQTKLVPPQQVVTTGAKPYCLLSVRNQFDLELHGELCAESDITTPGQPFIARSTIRLIAGWECIEVFPGFTLDAWNVDFAPLWAEHDVLGAALIAQTKDTQLSALDPRASARRQYAALLADFKVLLDSNPEREQLLQTFLENHPILLCPTHVRMWPKLPLGATITDFVFRDATQEYLLVELERSTLQLFRQDGHATADLTHAHGQIVDWKRYLEDNLQTVQRELGLAGITPNPHGLLVIGRSQSLLPKDRRKLQTMMNESPKLRIMTYDDVYENAKAVFENLLGPIWDTGGDTQIYYPHAT
ncbi:MAG: DUF4263 domain-containing protein [Sulfuritalea sp.]|nr:DUF4263 domain-containing protein [Sulfuritalea sp.]